MKKDKLDCLVLLRAVAVISVCLCHFGHPLESAHLTGKLFRFFHDYGKYGVHIFFVVSGFVIPLSLHVAQYSSRDYFRFLIKRLIRLHPPYLIALGLTLLISFFSYRARGVSYPETGFSVLQSLFYIYAPADNPVFWTLAVEAQYYLFIGLFYSLLVKAPKLFIFIAIPFLLVASQSQVGHYIHFFSYIHYFLIGMIGFLIYTSQGSVPLNLVGLTILLGATIVFDELPAFIAALLAITVILWYRKTVPSVSKFYGEISYSFYLIHFPVGIKFINLTSRYISPAYNWVIFMLAVVLVSGLSWVFYKLVEKPSATRSGKIKYRPSLDPILA